MFKIILYILDRFMYKDLTTRQKLGNIQQDLNPQIPVNETLGHVGNF